MRGSVWDLGRMPKGGVYRGMRMSMYGEGRGLSGAAALPPATPIPAMGHSLRHPGDSGLPSASPPPTPRAWLGLVYWHICLGTSKSGAGDLL